MPQPGRSEWNAAAHQALVLSSLVTLPTLTQILPGFPGLVLHVTSLLLAALLCGSLLCCVFATLHIHAVFLKARTLSWTCVHHVCQQVVASPFANFHFIKMAALFVPYNIEEVTGNALKSKDSGVQAPAHSTQQPQ